MQLFLDLVPCLAVVSTAGVLLTLILFGATQRRVSKLARAVIRDEESGQAGAAELANEMSALKRRIVELEKLEIRTCVDAPSDGDLSNAVRSMAFKLGRAGQGPDEIARKLHLSKGEVELLIKAQNLVMRPYENVEVTAPATVQKD